MVGSGVRTARTVGPEVAADWLVAYRYTVPDPITKAGQHRKGNRLRFGPVSRRDARNYLSPLAPGETVRVAVNPRNHEQSVLVAGAVWQGAVVVGAAAAIAITGVVWMLV